MLGKAWNDIDNNYLNMIWYDQANLILPKLEDLK